MANKVDFTIDGGLKAVQEVWHHLQNGTLEQFTNMLAKTGSTAPDGVILHGCTVTITGGGNTGTVSAGAVYIAGEIYTVDAAAGVVKTGTDDFVFKIIASTTTPSLDYFDASPQNPLQVRKATLSFEDNATSGTFMPYDADTLEERLHGSLLSLSPTLATDGGGGVWTASVGAIQYQHNAANGLLTMWCDIETNLATAVSAYLRLKLPVDRNGDQLSITGTVPSALGLHGTDVLKVTIDADDEYVRLTKAVATSFAVGGLDVISFSITLPVIS